MGNVATGSKNFGVVKGFHVYRGKQLNSTSESFLTAKFIELMETLNKLISTKADIEEINTVRAKMDELINILKARFESIDKDIDEIIKIAGVSELHF